MITGVLVQEALAPLNASYTATGLPFQGTIALPSAGGSQPVEMSLKQTAAQAWATEVALLHASGMTAEAQAANRYLQLPSISVVLSFMCTCSTCAVSLPAVPWSVEYDCSLCTIFSRGSDHPELRKRQPRDVLCSGSKQAPS